MIGCNQGFVGLRARIQGDNQLRHIGNGQIDNQVTIMLHHGRHRDSSRECLSWQARSGLVWVWCDANKEGLPGHPLV